MTDGFCDACTMFVGHEDIKIGRTPIGVFAICGDCREDISTMNRAEQEKYFTKLKNGELGAATDE